MSSLSEKLLSKGTLGTTYLYCVYMSRIVQVSKWRRDAKIGQILSTYTPILVHDSTKKKLGIKIGFFWIDHQIQFSFFTNSYGVGVIENLCMFISRREIKNSTLSKYMCSPSLMCQ